MWGFRIQRDVSENKRGVLRMKRGKASQIQTEESRKKLFYSSDSFLYVFISIFLFGIITHGYRFFNLDFANASLSVYKNTGMQMISIGRFLQPVYLFFRGNIYPPTFVGFLSLVFLGCSVCIIIELLNIENKVLVGLVCGVLVTNTTVTLTNATYIYDADTYMLALLFSVLAVYFAFQFRYGTIASMIAVCISIGLYQAFIQVTIIFFMFMLIKEILEGTDTKMIFRVAVKSLICLGGGLLLYDLALKIVLRVMKIELSNAYNGLTNVGKYEDLSSALRLIADTYKSTIYFFMRPQTYNSNIVIRINLLLIVFFLVLIGTLIISKKIYGWNLAILVSIIILIPF